MRQARRMAPRAVAAVMFTGPSVWWILLVLGNHLVANDGRVYRAAAGAWLAGHDPWSAVVNGYHAAAPPIAVMAFVPAALVPEDLFVPLWTGICFASALFIVRSLRLPGVWLIFPPLVFGVLLGNPAVPCLALAHRVDGPSLPPSGRSSVWPCSPSGRVRPSRWPQRLHSRFW